MQEVAASEDFRRGMQFISSAVTHRNAAETVGSEDAGVWRSFAEVQSGRGNALICGGNDGKRVYHHVPVAHRTEAEGGQRSHLG